MNKPQPFKKVMSVKEGEQGMLEANMRIMEGLLKDANAFFCEIGLSHMQWSLKKLSPLSYELTYYGPAPLEEMTEEWMKREERKHH